MSTEPSRVKLLLVARANRRRMLAWLSLLAGIPLLTLSPIILGTAFWFASMILLKTMYSWWLFALVIAALTLPLLFRLEMRTQGDYLGQMLNESEAIDSIPASAAFLAGRTITATPLAIIAIAINPRQTAAGFVELFLLGPRFVLRGLSGLRDARRLGAADTSRAAEIVAALLARDRGLEFEQLRKPSESVKDLTFVLVWLSFYGWVGVTDSMDRVYLYGESREILR